MTNNVPMVEVRMDDLGRVWIPAQIRRILGIDYGDVVNVTSDGESIKILKKEV